MEFNGGTESYLGQKNDDAAPNDRRVGLIFDEKMCKHYAPYDDYHPECPDRIRVIWDRLNSSGIAKRCVIMNAKDVEDRYLALVHTKKHIDLIKNISSNNSESKRKRIAAKFNSIYFNGGSSEAAYLAAGSVIEVAEKVAKGELDSAFAIIRPPGHHAEQDEPMGFCLYNNVAIAASYLLNERRELGINKILIVDWDVHHGNGTQKTFYDDPRVLFFSVHRHDYGTFYPAGHYGSYIMTGEGPGAGYNINVPWEQGRCGDADYIAVWDHILVPVAKEFNPDMIIISAGFDAALGDPLGGCRVSPYGYSILLEKLMEFAGAKIVMALEGGYNLKSLENSAHACVETLLQGKPIVGSLEAYPFESTWRVIQEVRQELSTYWPLLAVKLLDKVINTTTPVEISSSDSDGEHENKEVQPIEDVIQPLMNLKVNEDSQGPRAPSVKDLSLDFRVVWERIRRLAPEERDVSYLNNDELRLVAWVNCFPHHLSLPNIASPRIFDLPSLKKMANDAGVLGRLRLGPKTNQAPKVATPSAQEKKKKDAPGPSTERRSRDEAVTPLTKDNKRKLMEAVVEPAKEVPNPPIVEGPSKKKVASTKQEAPRGDPRRGRAFFGRDPDVYARIRDDDPNRPSLVVDFLSSRPSQHEVDVPGHVARATESLARAWTSELESVARRGLADSVQATVALALQAATMATKVAADWEGRPSVSSLQADLQASRRENANLADRAMNMEKASLAAEERAARDREQAKIMINSLMERALSPERSLKDSETKVADLTGSLERLAGDLKASRAEIEQKAASLEEREAELRKMVAELAALRAEKEEAENDPARNINNVSEFAYYMGYADAIRAAKGGGSEIGTLVEAFKDYVAKRPLHPDFLFPVLDLQTVHGVDLSWYPVPGALVPAGVPGEAEPETPGGGATNEPDTPMADELEADGDEAAA